MTWPTKTDFVDGDVLTAAQVNNIGTNLNLFDPTSATTGQVPVANGSGSVAWGSAGAYALITSGSLAGITTLTLSAIPGTYEHLELIIYDVYASALSTQLLVKPNGDAFAVRRYMYVDTGAGSTAVNAADSSTASGILADLTYMTNQSAARSTWVYTFYKYADTTNPYKLATCSSRSADFSTTDNFVGFTVSSYNESGAVTSIEIAKSGGATITAGNYELWGIK